MSDHNDHNGGIAAALRSVWFYYIGCSPCRKIGHRRETRREAEREKTLKARLEMDQPGLYRHPNPEGTNQYWMEDINMGPSLPKRGASKNTSQKRLKSADTDATTERPDTSPVDRGNSIGSSTQFHSAETANSPTIVADELEVRTTLSMSVTDSQDLDWNRKRYDREDEELWGHQMYNRAGQRIREVMEKGRNTAGRIFDASRPRGEREITEDERNEFYTAPRNPPVNDYHPPVVSSRPASKHEYRWMLQPPPSAKIMEGKVPVSRSGSLTSVASRRTATAGSLASKEELGLGRLVGEKIMQDKIRKGEMPPGEELTIVTSRPNTRRRRTASTMSSIPSQRSTRSRSNTTGSESSDTIYERRRQRRLAKQKAAEAEAGSEADDESEDERQVTSERSHTAQRPKLETIASSEMSSNKSENSEKTIRQQPNLAAIAASAGGSPLEDSTNRSNTTVSPVKSG